MLERATSHHILDIGGRTVSPGTISVINTDEEMELLNPPRHLTNTPTDAPTEASTPPPGWTDQLWVPEQVLGTAALCRAILRYRQANPELSDAMKAWTDHLMPSIEAFAHVTPNDLPPISINDYNSIVHLAWVQPFTDRIEQYRESPNIVPTLIRVSTPSELSITDAGVQVDEDPDHPGDRWMLFDGNNPGHYQVIFNNERGQPEVAKYIKYISVGDGMAVQGCRKKGTPAYGMALHARAFPNPNFSRPGIKDTDLSAFHPDSVNRLLVDNALVRLIDPGVVADVHTLRTQITKKKQIKRQRMELDAQEREADGKMVFVERYLVHGQARSRIQDHLMTT